MNSKKAKRLRRAAKHNCGITNEETRYVDGRPPVLQKIERLLLPPIFIKVSPGLPKRVDPMCKRGYYRLLKAELS